MKMKNTSMKNKNKNNRVNWVNILNLQPGS